MNSFGKWLLTATSLCPILAVYALDAVCDGQFFWAAVHGGLSLVLFTVCWWMLKAIPRRIQEESLKTSKVKLADKEALAFLLVYLLPFFNKDIDSSFKYLPTSILVMLVISVVVYHTCAFTFNPLLAALGYHFYEVESDEGVAVIVIAKDILVKQVNDLSVVKVSDYVFLGTIRNSNSTCRIASGAKNS